MVKQDAWNDAAAACCSTAALVILVRLLAWPFRSPLDPYLVRAEPTSCQCRSINPISRQSAKRGSWKAGLSVVKERNCAGDLCLRSRPVRSLPDPVASGANPNLKMAVLIPRVRTAAISIGAGGANRSPLKDLGNFQHCWAI